MSSREVDNYRAGTAGRRTSRVLVGSGNGTDQRWQLASPSPSESDRCELSPVMAMGIPDQRWHLPAHHLVSRE